MNIENTKAQMRKGVLEFCILSILSDGDAYPTEIIERMKLARLVVVEGTLYPLLTRLKNMDLLSYRWEESTSGPPRKYYRLTETGVGFLRELEATWDELVASVEQVTHKPQHPAITAATPFNPEAAPQPEQQANNHTTTNDNTEIL
jgi:PadR family transcriptional regulator, regulatory protein PadR